jgi:hypothetical protein
MPASFINFFFSGSLMHDPRSLVVYFENGGYLIFAGGFCFFRNVL